MIEGEGLIDRIMLDNFKISDIEKAVKINGKKYEIEFIHGISLKNINKYRNIKGIDYISERINNSFSKISGHFI